MTMTELEPRLVHAADILGSAWLNSPPVSIREHAGSVILLDFWDYSSASCLRALPYVQSWDRIYRESGLVTVGVHTPEFRFGSDETSVRAALHRLGVEYPVVLDNDAVIWNVYAARTWPTRVLIDRNGFVRFTQNGEGGYQQFERGIQILLRDSGYHGELPSLMEPLREEDAPGVVCYRSTGDLKGGYLRGALGNIEGYSPESTVDYKDPGFYIQGRMYLDGPWLNSREYVQFTGSKTEGSVLVPYEAREVNAVLGTPDKTPVEVVVEQDGRPLDTGSSGGDIFRTTEGRTIVRVGSPRMYQLIANADFSSHLLKLSVHAQQLDVYALSFVTGVMIHPYSAN